jgi:hypothetical protein
MQARVAARSGPVRQWCAALAGCLALAWPAAVRAQDGEGTPAMEGTWGVRLSVASFTRAPVIKDIESTMIAWALSEVHFDGQGLTQTYRVCDAEVRGTSRVGKTILPPVYVSHMPARSLRPEVARSADGWRWDLDLGVVPAGYHYEMSPTVLPQRADDPAVYDWDEDGHPGATVLVELQILKPFEVYITGVSHLFLRGRVISQDRIEGRVELLRQERYTIGASNRLFARQAHTRPDPANTVFVMERLPAGTTCAQVRGLMETP